MIMGCGSKCKEITFKADDTPDFGTPPGPATLVTKPFGRSRYRQCISGGKRGRLPGGATKKFDLYELYGDRLRGWIHQSRSIHYVHRSSFGQRELLGSASVCKTAWWWRENSHPIPPFTLQEKVRFLCMSMARNIPKPIWICTTSWNVWMMQGELLPLIAGSNQIVYRFDAGDVRPGHPRLHRRFTKRCADPRTHGHLFQRQQIDKSKIHPARSEYRFRLGGPVRRIPR